MLGRPAAIRRLRSPGRWQSPGQLLKPVPVDNSVFFPKARKRPSLQYWRVFASTSANLSYVNQRVFFLSRCAFPGFWFFEGTEQRGNRFSNLTPILAFAVPQGRQKLPWVGFGANYDFWALIFQVLTRGVEIRRPPINTHLFVSNYDLLGVTLTLPFFVH